VNQRVRFGEDIPDGLAHTVLFAEKYAACSYWALTEGEAVPWYRAGPTSGFQVRPRECDPTLAQTPHRERIQVSMADGSVRLVRRGISPATWYAAQTPAAGERLGHGAWTEWER
jgi:prepilin-type processing-associated H-X9-DG protein